MKAILIVLSSLFAISAFSAEPEPLYAKMNCEVYKTRLENGVLKEATLLVSNEGERFEVGMAQWLTTELPAPFQAIKVSFNHFSSYYNENGPTTSTPYIQAAFLQDKRRIDPTRVNFDIKNAVEGSKIMLRGTYKFNTEALLAYDCYFTYVK